MDEVVESTALTVSPSETLQPAPSKALADLREQALAVPVEVMRVGLAEYQERRDAFREWLLSQLKEGLHYGYPPGCEPRKNDRGQQIDRKGNVVPESQWRFKQCLYKAGADFLCDLMAVRDEYEPDAVAWQQSGGQAGTFVTRCRLFSRKTGVLLGEGRGLGRTGDEQLGANSALKKSQKRAKVDAAMNTWGLSDLFVQDTEDARDEVPHENPAARRDAPKTAPRGERDKPENRPIAGAELDKLIGVWVSLNENRSDWPAERPAQLSLFKGWVFDVVGREINRIADWTRADIAACYVEIDRMEERP